MTRKPVGKSSNIIGVPNLPQHNLPEPFASLQTAGFEEQIDLYQEISSAERPDEIASIVDRLTDMALDESYYAYSDPATDDEVDPRCFAPLQAVRSLCYFADHVARVVPRLVPLFETDDSALREELPLLFSCIGLEAVETLVILTTDADEEIYIRDGAAESLVELTNVYPELRQVVQTALEKSLVECVDEELCSYFILDLLDLGAIESLPFIEAAFIEARVDTEIITLTDVHLHFSGIENSAGDEDPKKLRLIHMFDGDSDEEEYQAPYVAPEKVRRNDPCPCGSGKKYKKCCGSSTS